MIPIVSFFGLVMLPLASFSCNATSTYLYKAGEGEEKHGFREQTLLTLNMDMLKGRLPKLYGGITAPVGKRAKALGVYLARENPDLFLAQEIPLESAHVVYEEIKGQFPHIWMGMGVKPGEQESGLFVASKYPLMSKPQFIPFGDAMQNSYHYPDELHDLYPARVLDRGFFALETPDFWIVDTHLEPGSPEQAGSCRREQLAYLTREMDRIAGEKPYILVGDLNIRRTGEAGDDYVKSGIPDLYYDFYTENHPDFDESTYTCTNLLEARANGRPDPIDPKDRNEIDDYVLIRKPFKEQFKIHVELLRDTYDVSKGSSEALTDHRAYRATLIVPKRTEK